MVLVSPFQSASQNAVIWSMWPPTRLTAGAGFSRTKVRLREGGVRAPRTRRKRTRKRPQALLQLAVFAASAVVEALVHVEPVCLGLARNARPDARQCLAPRVGDRLVALLAREEALSLREPAPRPFDRAVDRRVDLILHGAVLRPTDCHPRNIEQEQTVSRWRGSVSSRSDPTGGPCDQVDRAAARAASISARTSPAAGKGRPACPYQ